MRNEIYHQYAHSPKLVGLINGLAEGLSPQNSLKAFYDNVFNINSASGGGLDVWGDIFNIKRSLTLTLPNKSNYVTEIPQDIKLELNNGMLTLKAGSKVYVPSGFESNGTTKKFDTRNISDNITTTDTRNGKWLVFTSSRDLVLDSTNIGSGTSFPSDPATAQKFYNITNNKIYRYDGTSWLENGYSFPLAIVTVSNGAISSIDQVFNGFGYIGSTVFVLPGVKGLIPDGRNKDGTLKNIEYTTSSVLTSTQEVTGWNGKWSLYLSASSIRYHPTELEYISDTKPTSVYTTTAYWYSPLDNKLYFTQDTGATWTQSNELHCVDYTENSSKITSITPKLTSPSINVEQQYTMTDDEYRLILKLAASKNISDATCGNIYTVLSTVFSEFGNIYVSDLGEMHLRYSFEFLLSDTMYAILRQTRVVPRPAGVGIEIYEIPSKKIIGFNGQELETFDNGTFFQGVRE